MFHVEHVKIKIMSKTKPGIKYRLYTVEVIEVEESKATLVMRKNELQFHIVQEILGKFITEGSKYLITITPVEYEI